MKIENEVRVLDIDTKQFISLLEEKKQLTQIRIFKGDMFMI